MSTSFPDFVLNFTITIYAISLAWMISERINNFPKIRRLGAIFSISRENASDRYILSVGWLVVISLIGLSYLLIGFFYMPQLKQANFESNPLPNFLIFLFLKPTVLMLIPQYGSRFISSLVLANENAMRHFIENDYQALNIFSNDWKTAYHIPHGRPNGFKEKKGVKYGEINISGCQRAINSLIAIIVMIIIIIIPL